MIDVERPAQAPTSLASGVSYRGRDVLEALHAAFHGKCYLCEAPVSVHNVEVDHRRPQGDARFEHLRHDWSNLFPTCPMYRCNQRRPKRYPKDGVISPGEGVERRVAQEIERTVSTCLATAGTTVFTFRATSDIDAAAANTARELDRIHNDRSSGLALELRNAILQHMTALEPGMCRLEQLSRDPGASRAEIARCRQWAQRYVSRDAPFTMLVRSYFAHLDAVRALFD